MKLFGCVTMLLMVTAASVSAASGVTIQDVVNETSCRILAEERGADGYLYEESDKDCTIFWNDESEFEQPDASDGNGRSYKGFTPPPDIGAPERTGEGVGGSGAGTR
jgi:hypothetical protein